jgi:hypothetical protein
MNKKGLIALYTLLSVFLIGIIATVVVIAVTNKKVNTDISMLYVAEGIEGTVSATYKVGDNEEKAMTDSEGNLVVSFDPAQPSTIALLSPKEAITLNKGEDLILTYTFTNTGEEYYTNMTYSDMELKNLKLEYCNNETAEYSSEKSIITVPTGGSTKFSIKVSVEAPYRNATMEGTIDWTFANELKYFLDNNLLLNIANNAGSSVETFSCELNDDGTKFKIVGAVPENISSTTNNGTLSAEELTNNKGAEFYYFCTNPAVVGSYDYNTPGTIYWTSTADDTLENWYDIPDEPTTLYSCFMTPNFTGSSLSTNTESVVMSNSVTDPKRIVASGYSSSVKNAVIPQSVTVLGQYTFSLCTGITSITIPRSVTNIGLYAFSSCTGLTNITIPSSVKYIGKSAFAGCENLTSIAIPDSVTSIAEYAFSSCTGLTSISIGSNASLIYNHAFYLCSASLESISVDENNVEYTSINNCLIDKATNKLILGCKNSTIPQNVTSIGDNAFAKCTGLVRITIPDNVKTIGYYVFSGCTSLTNISIPDSITSIGSDTFSNCPNLIYYKNNNINYLGNTTNNYVAVISPTSTTITSYTLSDSTKIIYDKAFYKCTSLTSITMGNSLIGIGKSAFYGCTSLADISIPDSITSIDYNAFYNCTNLQYNTTSYIKYLGNETNKYVVAMGTTSNSITTCNLSDQTKVIYEKAFFRCTSIGSIVNLDGVRYIGEYAFYYCKELTSVTIPDSVTSIGKYAFAECEKLTTVTLGNNLTNISQNAFYDCTKLTSIKIPSSVISIGQSAFSNSLKSLEFEDTTSAWQYRYSMNNASSTIDFKGKKTWSATDFAQNAENLTSYTYRNATWTKIVK